MRSAWPSKYFTEEETTRSAIAVRKGIENLPVSILTQSNIVNAAHALDYVRDLLGTPILVDSWYRSPEVNTLVGGAPNSAHLSGWAIDFISPKFGTPADIFQFLTKLQELKFDQLILEFNHWVHISFDPRNRQHKLVYNGKSYREV